MQAANIASGGSKTDEESQSQKLVVGLNKASSKGKETPDNFSSRKVVLGRKTGDENV